MESTDDKKIIQTILDNLMDDEEFEIDDTSSSSSDSSSSDSTGSSNDEQTAQVRVTSFMEVVDKFSDADFKNHFRLSKETMAMLTDLYKSSGICPSHNHGGRVKVGPKKEIYLFIWYIANAATYRQMGNLFGVNEVTTWRVVNRVASWIATISNSYIIWPRSQQRIEQAMNSFEAMIGVSGVIGAIDGSHIKIKKPSINPIIYYNSKGYYSIILQAVVDASKRFIDVYCGEPGSLHDASVLRRSPIFQQTSKNLIFQNNSFLVGDSAYPSNSWIVTPYKVIGKLSDQQKKFNILLSSTRIVVVSAFGLLKGRFRRLLHFTEHADLETIKNIVVACCVLHNICINQNDEWDDVANDEEDTSHTNSESMYDNEGNRRQDFVNQLVEKNLL